MPIIFMHAIFRSLQGSFSFGNQKGKKFLDQNYSYTTKFIRRLQVVCIFIKGIHARALFYAKQHTVLEQW